MWQRLSQVWQYCVEEAWAAYCGGSLPHGAVITDAQGQVVARGRNRIREQIHEGRQLAGNRLAHAEMNALLELDWRGVDVYSCKLYSIIEPCPMCIGAVRMAHMKEVHYAVRDGGAGGTSLIDKTPFFKDGNITIFGSQDRELELVLMAVQIEATFSQAHPNPEAWIAQLARDLPLAETFGKQLFTTKQLVQWKDEQKDAAFVIDQLYEQLQLLA